MNAFAEIPKEESFVIASSIAADLSAVQTISFELYLSSLNAKVMVARSGEVARTFDPITEFALRLTGSTAEIVKNVEAVASRITRSSIKLMQAEELVKSVDRAYKRHGTEEPGAESIRQLVSDLRKEARKLRQDYMTAMRDVLLHIDYLTTEVRSIFILAMNCRIEAKHCAGFQSQFDTIANDIEMAAERVQKVVSHCRSRVQKELNSGGNA
ncbi:hypothetical protein [Sneathiella limimaris]|uniref:hypothetical protein n=1 Tax=Sneathiella limimaris TaxID=1964213 RepID=UPI00146A15B5|nr:hypothetical protein [Sneathiella limimaris]